MLRARRSIVKKSKEAYCNSCSTAPTRTGSRYPRFKRIRSPGFWSIFKTLFILIGLASTTYVFLNRQALIAGTFLSPLDLSNWLHLGSIALVSLFLWMTIHHFYVVSFGLSLKSISLKDIEIKPASDAGESILNRHLDEIIYFFQSTDYELVVVEDLDRFNDADIFVTLREINSLVNANAGVTRQIRFLYALRDDMFVNTDRTKFFEFIIPVIPIINASNSIDMVLDQGKRLALTERLNRQFLREVSRYLSDLRLDHEHLQRICDLRGQPRGRRPEPARCEQAAGPS